MNHLRPLSDLKVGEHAIVERIESLDDSDETFARRLYELGFVPGAPIEMMHRSPFHRGPMSFEIRSTQIALRFDEARRVLCKESQTMPPNGRSL